MLDEPELPEHEVQEPEDVHEKGKPRHDLFKTHFTMLLSVTHPMSTSPAPVIEYVASVSAITYTALSPVTENVAPAPVVVTLRSGFLGDRLRESQ